MRRFAQIALTVAVAALMASPVLAQQRQRQGGGRGMAGGGALALLRDKGVQQELKLTADQIKAVDAAAKKQEETMQAARGGGGNFQELFQKLQAINKEATDTLKPDQKKRLHQLELQQRGLSALAAPANPRNPNPQPSPLAKELNITEAQQKQIQDIVAANREKMRDIRQNAAGNREEIAKKTAELNKNTNEKIMGILTADQKAKWKEMTGEPYKGQLPAAGFGGGFGGGRRPGGGGGARPPV
jgi:hypothetical protein